MISFRREKSFIYLFSSVVISTVFLTKKKLNDGYEMIITLMGICNNSASETKEQAFLLFVWYSITVKEDRIHDYNAKQTIFNISKFHSQQQYIDAKKFAL